MNRTQSRYSMLLAALMSALIGSALATAADQERPNVVLIMTDNHGAWTLGCYGNPEIRTPHIDQLAADGTLFTRSFASNPVCSPTRATFLTGLLPSQHGVHSFLSGGNLQIGPKARNTLEEFKSLPEILKRAGYACGLVGKWHLGDNLNPQEGFEDYWITMPHGGTSTFYNAPIIENGKVRIEPTYLTDFWTQHAVKFIDQQAISEDPFFLFLAYNGPYSLGRLLLRDGQNRHAAYYADKELPSFPRQPPHPWQLNNRDYINNPTSIRRIATEVSGVDDGVGQVLDALAKNKLDENTVVIFVADQGWVGGHGGFFGMGDHTRPLTARDGMMLIPTIWKHPHRIASGRRSDRMIANYDLMPTLLNHLGLASELPATMPAAGSDYSSAMSVADEDDDQSPYESIYYEFENLRCVRTETHKYVHRYPNGPHELYDLTTDPDEFVNLNSSLEHTKIRDQLRKQLFDFYDEHANPKYDMWHGGTSQVRIHDGIDEELAQLTATPPPPRPSGYQPAEFQVPPGFSTELVAGPPLVTHPTMGCFDDQGRLYVCNNAGVNRTNEQLEQELPNEIRQLTDRDGDGVFDDFTVFADKMTFPMGGVWRDGALFVASPPYIWRLEDTDNDGVADRREKLVSRFGYNGNAASIHGCFAGPDGRIYWTDGYHGHEFKDSSGQITSQREGSYLFSCRTDGSDKRIHCGGGMDNPVEIDFTGGGDMFGTVNILYSRPRVDALVHWLHGGAYPHREQVLRELQVTGERLGPAHRFGHVAVSGMTRYRSGTMDHRWQNDLFVTFFNQGKVVRLVPSQSGSSYAFSQHEFLSSTSRDFHPTDVIEDADGSLLVVDTGGWFYRGCPTSQFAKPELLGGIYRVVRDGMTTQVNPRGKGIRWDRIPAATLTRLLNDTRHVVRQRAMDQCVLRSTELLPTFKSQVSRADIRVRQNITWIAARLAANSDTAKAANEVLTIALGDKVAEIRQAACRGLALSEVSFNIDLLIARLDDENASVRRTAATALGQVGNSAAIPALVASLSRNPDRSEEHAITFALIEIGNLASIRAALADIPNRPSTSQLRCAMTAIDQIDATAINQSEVIAGLMSTDDRYRREAMRIARKHLDWADRVRSVIHQRVDELTDSAATEEIESLIGDFLEQPPIIEWMASMLASEVPAKRMVALRALTRQGKIAASPSWIKPLTAALRATGADERRVAIQAVSRLEGDEFIEPLRQIAGDGDRSPEIRLQALEAIVRRNSRIDDDSFAQLVDWIGDSQSVAVANQAAELAGSLRLADDQLRAIVQLIPKSNSQQLKSLLGCFTSCRQVETIQMFLDAVEDSQSLLTLAEHELSDVIKRFPPESLPQANRILDSLREHAKQKRKKLEQVRDLVSDASVERGRRLYSGRNARCNTCHQVGTDGKRVGPDLTTIGANRSVEDLLESILFPSASIVRDYDAYRLLTIDGRVINGMLVSQNDQQYVLQTATGDPVTIATEDVQQISISPVSIMPNGLDDAIGPSQLADIVAYLKSLK